MNLPPRCQAQIGVRPRLWLNAVMIPYAVICPNSVSGPDRRWCAEHQDTNKEESKP